MLPLPSRSPQSPVPLPALPLPRAPPPPRNFKSARPDVPQRVTRNCVTAGPRLSGAAGRGGGRSGGRRGGGNRESRIENRGEEGIEGRRAPTPGRARGRAMAVQLHGGARGKCMPGVAGPWQAPGFSPAAEDFPGEKPELSVPVCPRAWEWAPGLSSARAAPAPALVLVLLLPAVIVIHVSICIYGVCIYIRVCM